MTGFQVYVLFIGIKLHFNSDNYNFVMYNGKIRSPSREKFEARKDKHFFNKLSHIYTDEEVKDLFIANFREKPDIWVGDLLNDRAAKDRLAKLNKVKQSLSYTVKNDLDKLFAGQRDPADAFRIRDGQNPPVLNLLYSEEIAIETFIIMDDLIHFTSAFERLDDTIIWPKRKLLVNKYRNFFEYDKIKFKELFVTVVKNIMGNSPNTQQKESTEQ